MAAGSRGHTTGVHGGSQLELGWEVPPASPATTDFVCWLWAAFPPRDGRLNVSRIAKALGTSPRTLRRWIASDNPNLSNGQIPKLRQRAILRGRGHYLWPDLDPVTRQRSDLLYADAMRNDELIRTEPERVAPTWRENGTLAPHVVQIVYYPRAHVYGVSAATHDKARARVTRNAEIVETTIVGNKYAAIALKHEILRRVDEHRCIAPKQLVPTGRTETWRESGGHTTIRRPLEVSVVRFAGLPADRRLVEDLRRMHPLVRFTDYEATNAVEACEALARAADLVVLACPGHTRTTWGNARRQWPGGRWYAGGRGPRTGGMSLTELARGITELGGIQAPTLVIAATNATTARTPLRRTASLGEHPTQVLLQTSAHRGPRETHELAEIIHRTDHHRPHLDRTHPHPTDLTTGLTRYTPA